MSCSEYTHTHIHTYSWLSSEVINYSLLSILLWWFFLLNIHTDASTRGKASWPEEELMSFGINFISPSRFRTNTKNSLAGFFSPEYSSCPASFKYLFRDYVPFGSFGLTRVSWTSAVHHLNSCNKSAADAIWGNMDKSWLQRTAEGSWEVE